MKRTRIYLVLALAAGLVLPLLGTALPIANHLVNQHGSGLVPLPVSTNVNRSYRLSQVNHLFYEDGWQNDSRYQLSYNAQNQVDLINFEVYEADTFTESAKFFYYYRPDGQPLSIICASDESPEAEVYQTQTFEYEDDRLVHVHFELSYSPTAYVWEKFYTYDETSGKVGRIEYNFYTNAEYTNSKAIEFEWDSYGRPVRLHYYAKQSGMDWAYTQYEDIQWMTVDSSNYDDYLRFLAYEWSSYAEFGYGHEFKIQEVTVVHSYTVNEVPVQKQSFVYDANGRCVQQIVYTRSNNGWQPVISIDYAYNNNLLASTTYYNILDGEVESDLMVSFQYEEVMSTHEVTTPSAILSLSSYPNPFLDNTQINYELNKDGVVEIDIYNMKGQLVCHLLSGYRTTGTHQEIWNGLDERGNRLGSGAYFLVLRNSGSSRTTKLILLK